jgi:hypothetical protein
VSLPYVHRVRPGEFIRVSRSNTGACLVGTSAAESGPGDSVRILPGDVPLTVRQIAEAMHEAVGLPAPLILERPCRANCDQFRGDGFRTYLATGNLVGIDGDSDDMSPAAARFLASRLAALADIADGEPDPAEVEELATLLHDAREVGVKVGYGEWDLRSARAALRWMKDKQQRGEQP